MTLDNLKEDDVAEQSGASGEGQSVDETNQPVSGVQGQAICVQNAVIACSCC